MPKWIKFPQTIHDPSDNAWDRVDTVTNVSVDGAKEEATKANSCFFVYCNSEIQVHGRVFEPGTGVCSRHVPWIVQEPNTDLYIRELTPRNIVWVSDDVKNFSAQDYFQLIESGFTHAIMCSFHIDPADTKPPIKHPEPWLVYNGAGRDPNSPDYDSWWKYVRSLREGPNYKTVMLSVGGWNSGTWKNARGKEEYCAKFIVEFAQKHGFAGIDFNFEGDEEEDGYWSDPPPVEPPYPNRREILATFAKMAVAVRKLWKDGYFTIAPIWDEIGEQLDHIRQVAGGTPLSDLLSWINVQFYKYPNPQGDYETVLAQNGLPANMVVAGFPLSEHNGGWNKGELEAAGNAVREIYSKHGDFAGLFVWRYRFLWAGNQWLDWAKAFNQILRIPFRTSGTEIS